ncbi:MAG: Secretion system C-terminal sorting domain [Flavipsychrobacter sp.]|jgi:hypothetical protein|nr:Secretion system C-terminal sorting domain [Flavipsychrobacter sp.]
MKKIFFLFAIILATTRVQAQPGGRWYNYVDSVLPDNINVCTGMPAAGYNWTNVDLWWDTTSIWGYNMTGPAYANTAWVSYGLGFHPFSPAWNDGVKFGCQIGVRSFDAYTIDSIIVAGIYGRNPASPYADTLIITFVNGDGAAGSALPLGLVASTASHYCVSSAPFVRMFHDSLTNRAVDTSVITGFPHTYKFVLTRPDSTNIMSATVGLAGTTNIKFPRAGHSPPDPVITYAVPAGHMASVSISFKSGDPTYPASYISGTGFKDTVRYAPATIGAYAPYKHSGFSPYIRYAVTTAGGTTPTFPGFVANAGPTQPDWTSGYFKRMGARGAGSLDRFSANWEYTTSTGGADVLQYPYVSYHVYCSTCPILYCGPGGISEKNNSKNISVNPNPADGQLTISFPVAAAKVSLVNIIGKEVAAQTVNGGNAIFNTTNLPAGMYIYIIQADGWRTMDRVLIIH